MALSVVAMPAAALDIGGISTDEKTEEKSSDSSSGEAAADEQLQKMQSRLKKLKSAFSALQRRSQEVDTEIQLAPTTADQLRQQLTRMEAVDPNTQVSVSVDLTLEELEQAITQNELQVSALEQSLASVMENIGIQQSLPVEAKETVESAQKKIDSIEARMRSVRDSSKPPQTREVELALANQEKDNAQMQQALAQKRLDGYQKLLDQYTVNRDLLNLQLDVRRKTLEKLRKQRDALRLDLAGREQAQTDALDSEITDRVDMLAEAVKQNRKFARQVRGTTENLNRVTGAIAGSRERQRNLRYSMEVAKQQLNLTDINQHVDKILFEQRQKLQASIQELGAALDDAGQIAAARLDQFRLDEAMQEVRTVAARRAQVEAMIDELQAREGDSKLAPELIEQAAKQLEALLLQRRDQLNNLIGVHADYVVGLTNLDLAQREELTTARQFYELLNQKLFWRRSADPVEWSWFTALPGSAYWFLFENDWGGVWRVWYERLVVPVIPLLSIILALGLFQWSRSRMVNRLHEVSDRIGNVMRDEFRYTLEALLISLVLAAPLPLLILALGYTLSVGAGSSVFIEAVGEGMYELAAWLYLFELMRHLCRQKGLARSHFSWHPERIKAYRRWTTILYLQLPWAFVFTVVWRQGDDYQAGTLGRATFIITLVLFIWFIARVLSPHVGALKVADEQEQRWFHRFGKLLFWSAVLVPTGLVVLAMAGYSFTAMEITLLMYRTLILGYLLMILHHVLGRWFSVAERKLAYERALQKREAMRKAKQQQADARAAGDAVPEVELPRLDVATISEQNRALLRVFTFALFAVGCIPIWRDLFQVVESFQDVTLWQSTLLTDNGEETQSYTLYTLLYTIGALLLTYIGVKNLPGLIEVVILQRFHVEAGIRFAVTTIARYLVVVIGTMTISSLIGLDWSKLGWLVAALGVGLGFGLQEIFANFVSGLIMLFERPIRIGDTVTINGVSGTVSRIRMRATTITDWDQKELIIPNKAFVTTQFVNWTLSDTVTRLVIPVGVAYGSDTDLVTRLLLELADGHEVVLNDPAPSAIFLGFGASSLDFELRVFVSVFSKRMPLLHELNTAIDQRFKAEGIEIAFPQMDVHVRDWPQIEKK